MKSIQLDRILPGNMIWGTLLFYLIKVYLFPHWDTLLSQSILIPILFLHAFRQLGLMFLARGATLEFLRSLPLKLPLAMPLSQSWEKVKSWFGFRIHLLVDANKDEFTF